MTCNACKQEALDMKQKKKNMMKETTQAQDTKLRVMDRIETAKPKPTDAKTQAHVAEIEQKAHTAAQQHGKRNHTHNHQDQPTRTA